MNNFKVGLMALAAIAAVVIMSLKVTSNQSGFGEYIAYSTTIKNATGIFAKSPIKVAGISVGRINSITLDRNTARVSFEILEKVKIPKNSQIVIRTVGLLGDKFLEIQMGAEDELLSAGDHIPSSEGGGMAELMNNASVMLKGASEALTDVKVILGALKETVAVDKDGHSPLKRIMRDFEAIASNTKEMTKSLRNVVTGNEDKFNRIIGNMDKFSEQLAYHLDQGEEGSAMTDLKSILDNADRMTRDLQELVSDIKAGKGSIGQILVEDEIADEVRETIAGVKQIIGKVNSIRTELSAFAGGNSKQSSTTEVGLKIFPSPERFYLLGIRTSEFGVESETHTTTIINGVSTSVIRKEREKGGLRFNAQLGRIVQNWTFRGGLIESTGGLGLDYFISNWGTKFHLDAFNFGDDTNGTNIRLGSSIQIWNVLHGRVEFENINNNARSATISAGLIFNDEDLKGLLGFFL